MNKKQTLPWGLVLLLSLVLVVGAAACGGGDDDEGNGDQAAQTGGETGDTAAAEEPISVGLVTDIGGLNDEGFNELANTGLEQAADELGVETRVLESQSDADYIPNLSQLGEEGFDLVISNGFLMGEDTETAANEFPDTNFAIIDFGYEEPPANLLGIVFKEEQAGYLVGYLGALVSESGTVSAVGGQAAPAVDAFLAGFQKGAMDAKPDINVLLGYSQDFVDQAKCKEVALDQIAKGSDVVFQAAGGCGLGALDAASEQDVWGIGVDKDQADLGDHILTSAVKRVDLAVYETIKAAHEGTFEGGARVFGLEEEGVALGTVSDEIDQALVDQVMAQQDKILAGEIEIPRQPTK